MRVREVRIRPHVRDGAPTGRWVVDIPPGFTLSGKRERPLVADELAARQMKARIEGGNLLVDTTSGAPIVMDPVRAARLAKSGKQPGDFDKAAQALLELVNADVPPVRLFLGEDALGLVQQKLDAVRPEASV